MIDNYNLYNFFYYKKEMNEELLRNGVETEFCIQHAFDPWHFIHVIEGVYISFEIQIFTLLKLYLIPHKLQLGTSYRVTHP